LGVLNFYTFHEQRHWAVFVIGFSKIFVLQTVFTDKGYVSFKAEGRFFFSIYYTNVSCWGKIHTDLLMVYFERLGALSWGFVSCDVKPSSVQDLSGLESLSGS
jgi:hypothetical protein